MLHPFIRHPSIAYPHDYGLPKMNKFPQNTSNTFEPNMTNQNRSFQTNYRNSKNYFKPIIINSSPFRRSNDKLKNDKKCMSREGVFLDQTPTQGYHAESVKEETLSNAKPSSGFIPYQHKEERYISITQEPLSPLEKDIKQENVVRKVGSEKNKLFHVLKIIKDSKTETNKYKRYSMNNFDELKKAESLKDDLKDKYFDENYAEEDLSANLATFQKLNKNLCKGNLLKSIIIIIHMINVRF